jgi:hypothetical protein
MEIVDNDSKNKADLSRDKDKPALSLLAAAFTRLADVLTDGDGVLDDSAQVLRAYVTDGNSITRLVSPVQFPAINQAEIKAKLVKQDLQFHSVPLIGI